MIVSPGESILFLTAFSQACIIHNKLINCDGDKEIHTVLPLYKEDDSV